jgi:predicted MFS family arabinose efflux permease
MVLPTVLRDRNFLLYSLGNVISWLGTWAQRIGVGWLSWALTHQTSWVGLISLAQILPLVFFGPLFGALLDRHDHRRYAITVNTVLALLAVALYVLTAAHRMNIGILFTLALFLGVANSAYQAARLAMVNDVVDPALLAAAIAANSICYNLTRALGPAIAGVIIARYGLGTAFAVNAVSFLGIIGALLFVQLRPLPPKKSGQSLLAESREGLHYVLQHPGIRQVVLLTTITSTLVRGVLELMPAFADSVFGRGSVGLADLTTATGVGAMAGALVLARVGSTASLPSVARQATIAVGVLTLIFGLCRTFLLGLLLNAALGFAMVLCSVGLQVLLQSSIHDHFRGRVLGLWTATNVAGPGIGGALIGAAAQQAGLMSVTIGAGMLCLLLVLWAMPARLLLGKQESEPAATSGAR